MKQIKFIFTGPPGAGKTTAIASISEFPPVSTDVFSTDGLSAVKEKTTVAMDFGQITLDNGQKIGLYGTPGQQRFKFMWDILVQGGLGLIVLVDNRRPNPLKDLGIYLDNFADFIKKTDAVIGVTCSDIKDTPSLDDYQNFLQERGQIYPIFAVDARNKDDVIFLLNALLTCLETT
ncbi:MAG: ATP/GTP-binding protein [Candidatus Competibacteraceae bacterium]|nr:ATP/GTP-binding protein [Candidatus Competibacteraceae bacterium]MBK7982853.1 ATP/GTP-binding protein [Candidatus Competibacteraceae bacterium]MBK8898600.1 ATP/GTP-binding protein [Candidatus Competibacteraceae bacterium]MBK8962403.1 ATP/GTP-binding protein [Candidatus Competibacteraceae bacterium]MBK9951618.1 ATP/GTP-binding protein [Candidatus Competibacteraceae bacterium]